MAHYIANLPKHHNHKRSKKLEQLDFWGVGLKPITHIKDRNQGNLASSHHSQ
jgi:hypothetical protein